MSFDYKNTVFNKIIKKFMNQINNNAIYIIDTKVDYVVARKSNIKFTFAKYGFRKI